MKTRVRRIVVALTAGLALSATTVPAASSAQQSDTLAVMSLNTWHGGAQVTDGLNKIVHEIKNSNADVVALQESSKDVTKKIADKLGWNHTSSGWDIDVISEHTIEKVDSVSYPTSGAQAVAAKIKGVWVYSVHLDYTKYGPYNACFDNDSYPTIYADEESRKNQARDIVNWAGSSPAIIAGDLNTPSQLDWTEATKSKHCDSVVAWPATKVFWDNGYWDSYREVNPSEVDSPGETWSPVFSWNDDYDKPEPQDRIDFIMYKGGSLDATSSRTYGGGSAWPSDHLAVITTFNL